MRRRGSVCAVGAFFVLFWMSLAALGSTQIVVLSGQAMPGAPAGFTTFFSSPFLNDQSQVGFTNYRVNSLSTMLDNARIFLAEAGSIYPVADAANFAPDGTVVHSSLQITEISGDGDLVLAWQLLQANGQPTLDHGAFAGNPSTLTPLARYGQSAPDGNGTLFRIDGAGKNEAYNNNGQFAFFTELLGTTGDPNNKWAILRKDGNQFTQIGRTGMLGPGGSTIASVSSLTPGINEVGQVAFRAQLVGGPATSLLRSDGSTITKLVDYGQTSPRGDGVVVAMPDFAFNNAGQAGFITGDVIDLNDANTYRLAVFRAGDDGLKEVARVGDPAPGGNGTLDYFYPGSSNQPPLLNDAGQMAFLSDIAGSAGGSADNRALILSSSDGATLTQIVRKGQPAPNGNGLMSFPSNTLTELNNLGQVAYRATFTGTIGGTSDDGAIMLWTGGQTFTVAREGDSLLGSQITLVAGFDLNNVGQVAYRFSLADGRGGIALWSIPEPASCGLFCFAISLIISIRCRRRAAL